MPTGRRGSLGGLAAGDADSGDARQAGGDGVDVGKVHLERVVHLFAELEGRNGGRGGDDDVDFVKRLDEVARNEGPHFLGFQIVGIIIAGT